MANDYQFNFTDPNKTPFVVKPYTINGYESPDSVPLPAFFSTSGGVTAVSANTSLVFVGKGMPEYGDAVQNNFIYLLENFANVNPPINPIEGQIWYKNVDLVDGVNPTNKGLYVNNGATWDRLLVETSAGMTGDLNMGGFVITNVGGTGAGYNAVSELDVAAAISTHAADGDLHLSVAQNALLDGLSPTLTNTELNYVEGVASPIQAQLSGKLSTDGSLPMLSDLSMGSNKIVNLADPTAPDEAATKAYVDLVAGSGGTADGVVTSGDLDPVSGVLTLNRSVGTPVIVTGTFAPAAHSQNDDTVWHDLSAPLSQSFLVGQGLSMGEFPLMAVYNAIAYLDQMVYDSKRHVHRQLITTAGETTLTLSADMAYNVNENKLQVFLNGIKQIANERGSSKIVCHGTNIGLMSDTGLLPSTSYTFDITVDVGAPTTVNVTTPASTPVTYVDLLYAIDVGLTSTGANVSVNVDQYFDYLKFIFVSHTAGVGSAVTVSAAPGELFTSIVATTVDAPVNKSVTTNYTYTEVGLPNESSVTILFDPALPVSATLEVLVWP